MTDLNMPPAEDVHDVDMINEVHPLEVETPEKTGTSCPRYMLSIAAYIPFLTHELRFINTLVPTLTPDDDDARAHMKYYELKANYEVLMGTYKNSF